VRTCPLNEPLPLPLEALPPEPKFSFVQVPSKTCSTTDPETTSPITKTRTKKIKNEIKTLFPNYNKI